MFAIHKSCDLVALPPTPGSNGTKWRQFQNDHLGRRRRSAPFEEMAITGAAVALENLQSQQVHCSSFSAPLSGLTAPDFPATDACFFRELKHGAPQQPIRFGLIAVTISFEPGNDVAIQPHSYRFFLWPIELADFGLAPIENRGHVGKINVLVSFCGDSANVSLLLLCELPHRLSFHATQQHERK